MSKKVEITALNSFASTTDQTFAATGEEKLVIGTEDKSINVFKDGVMVEILQRILSSKISDNEVILKLPIIDETGALGQLIVQIGRVDIPASSTQTYNFLTPYLSQVFAVFPGLTLTSSDTGVIKADKESLTQFRMRNTGAVTARSFWLAFGT